MEWTALLTSVRLIIMLLHSACDTEAMKELDLLVLEPQPDLESLLPEFYRPSYAEGPALYLAAKLAAEMVNMNDSILQGYHLNLLREDSGCNVPFRAVEAFVKPLSRSILGEARPIAGVIGPTCSSSALSVSALTGRHEIALINIPLASTHRLRNRTEHPYSFSILDSTRLIAGAIVSLTGAANWKKVALFYDTSRQYFSSIVEVIGEVINYDEVEDYLEPVGITGIELSPFLSIKNEFRIVVLLVGTDLLSKMLCIAHEHDYSHPAYQYVVDTEVIEAVNSTEFELESRSYNCSRNQVRKMLIGSIQVNHQIERLDNLDTKSGISLQTFNELYNGTVHSFNMNETEEIPIEPSLYGSLFYDAVWSLALALDAVSNVTDLALYNFGQPNVTDLIKAKLLGLDFEGISGRIQFNETTGHVDQNATYSLLNEENITDFAYYRKENDNVTFYPPFSYEDVFISDRFDEIILTVPKPLTYFVLVVILFGFLLTLVLNILTCVYHNVGSVKASSINMSQVAFSACYIHVLSMLLAVLIYGFTDEINSRAVCKIQHLLDFSLSIGLTTLLGTICMRIWRLHRIFNHYRNPGKRLSDRYLILSIAIIVAIDLALTVPAFFSDQYRPEAEETRSNNVVIMIVTCKRSSSGYFILWFSASLLVSTALLITIFVLAILTRKIPQKNFKTKSTMYLSYTLTAVVPPAIGIYFMSSYLGGYASMVLRFCTLCLLLLCLIIIPCAMLFSPPLLPILKKRLPFVSVTRSSKWHASLHWHSKVITAPIISSLNGQYHHPSLS